MTLANVRDRLALFILSCYLILNYGFMILRVPPSVGAPFGELLLLCYLLWLTDVRFLPRFSHALVLPPFLLWWSLGFGQLLVNTPAHGMWAFRDATHVIESLFLWVGFVFATKEANIERFFRWLPRLLVIGVVYGLTFPFSDFFQNLSPAIISPAGNNVTILFQYVNSSVMLLMAAAYLMIIRPKTIAIGPMLLASLLLAFVVAFFQARTVYLQVLAMLLLFAWQYRSSFAKMSSSLAVGMVAFLVVSALGIQFTGRIGGPISFEFMIAHFATIMGKGSGELAGAAGGVDLRIGWWVDIWERVTSSFGNLFFGLGYGEPLVKFVNLEGSIVREPHNSYISVFARIGAVGLFAFVWMHIVLVLLWSRAFRLCRRAKYRVGQERLLTLFVFFLLIWIFAIGEDALEKPFNTIPYYFFWGVIVHYSLNLRAKLKAPLRHRRPLRTLLQGQIQGHPSRP
ncbi:MAG: O-antigen ligase family protein [Pseudomonadota bacterium]